jgi:hypothetical protein
MGNALRIENAGKLGTEEIVNCHTSVTVTH